MPEKSDEICPVCYWHDDTSGLRYPAEAVGPNHVSLLSGQRNFLKLKVCDPRLLGAAITVNNFAHDARWRPLDPDKDSALLARKIAIGLSPAERRNAEYWVDSTST